MRATSIAIAILCCASTSFADQPDPPAPDPCAEGIPVCNNPEIRLKACWSGRTVCVGERVWDPAYGQGVILSGFGLDINNDDYLYGIKTVSVTPGYITQEGTIPVTAVFGIPCAEDAQGKPIYTYYTITFTVEATDPVRPGSLHNEFHDSVHAMQACIGGTYDPDEPQPSDSKSPRVGFQYSDSQNPAGQKDQCDDEGRGSFVVKTDLNATAYTFRSYFDTVGTADAAFWLSASCNGVIADEGKGSTTRPSSSMFRCSVLGISIPIPNMWYSQSIATTTRVVTTAFSQTNPVHHEPSHIFDFTLLATASVNVSTQSTNTGSAIAEAFCDLSTEQSSVTWSSQQ